MFLDRDDAAARLMAPVVHEIRNFLTPMRLSLEVLRRRVIGDVNGERAFEILRSQTEGLSRLVDDLLDASRIATGKFSLQLRDCVLQDVARHAVEMCGPSALEQSLQLTLDCTESPLHVMADPLRLRQALANLIFNAQHYTPQGGRIRVELRRDGAWAKLRVVDEGMGMRPESVSRVFELYERPGKPAHDGLGIGLYLVKSITQLHGGRVSAASAGPGKGSSFTIALPLRLEVDV